MVFLPLGLKARIFKIPWVTLGLTAAIIAVSFASFETVDRRHDLFLRSPTQLRVAESKLKLISFLCPRDAVLRGPACDKIAEVSARPVYSFMEPYDRVKSALTNGQLARFAELFFDAGELEKAARSASEADPFRAWKELQRELDAEINVANRDGGLLSKGNFRPLALFKAQFVHGSFMHLFGNLLFFVALSIFVELRTGALLYSALYLTSGLCGLALEILTMSSASTPLMGASANIAGVAGAFTVLFWKKRMRVFGTLFFVFNRTFSVPVYFFFPVLVVAGDVAGALNSNGSVAHKAHLGGFFVGALIAWLVAKADELPSDFTFLEEERAYRRVREQPPETRWDGCLRLLRINPANFLVHRELFQHFVGRKAWSELGAPQREYLTTVLPEFLADLRPEAARDRELFRDMGLDWPHAELFRKMNGKQLQALLHEAEASGDTRSAYLCLRSLAAFHPRLAKDPQWTERIRTTKEKLDDVPAA